MNTVSKTKWWCVVPDCRSDSRKSLTVYPFMRGVRFFPFPTQKDPYMRQMWVKLIKRENDWDGPKRHHRICSRHFVDGEPSLQNPAPTIFPWTPSQTIFPKTDYRNHKNRVLYGGHNPPLESDNLNLVNYSATIQKVDQSIVSQVSLLLILSNFPFNINVVILSTYSIFYSVNTEWQFPF